MTILLVITSHLLWTPVTMPQLPMVVKWLTRMWMHMSMVRCYFPMWRPPLQPPRREDVVRVSHRYVRDSEGWSWRDRKKKESSGLPYTVGIKMTLASRPLLPESSGLNAKYLLVHLIKIALLEIWKHMLLYWLETSFSMLKSWNQIQYVFFFFD